MDPSRIRTILLATVATGFLLAGAWVAAQQAGLGIASDLAGYFGWDRANVQKSFIESAHPAAKDVYFNDLASDAVRGGDRPFPDGSVIVKEVTSPDTLQVEVLTTMRKVDGFGPDQGDWQYGRWDRTEAGGFDGGWMPLDGAQGCVACHVSASDDDFVFADYLPD